MTAPHGPLPSAGNASTSLDPHETNVDPYHATLDGPLGSIQTPDIVYRHSGWSRTRHRVAACLKASGAGQARLERFCGCGSGAWLFRTLEHPRRYKIAANYCRDRFCTPCSRAKSLTIGQNVAHRVRPANVRFLTLTLQSTNETLRELLNHLIASFRRLRATRCWAKHVRGGLSCLEIKYNAEPGRWHVHLHALIEGGYFPQTVLQDAWRRASRGSYIVDIRKITSARQAMLYVVKYATKSIDHALTHDEEHMVQAILALRGRRSVTTFGTWRGIQLHKAVNDGCWEPFAPLRDVLAARDRGDALAIWVLKRTEEYSPWTQQVNDRSPPPSP